jgi:hypothetical protein
MVHYLPIDLLSAEIIGALRTNHVFLMDVAEVSRYFTERTSSELVDKAKRLDIDSKHPLRMPVTLAFAVSADGRYARVWVSDLDGHLRTLNMDRHQKRKYVPVRFEYRSGELDRSTQGLILPYDRRDPTGSISPDAFMLPHVVFR